MLFFLYSRFGKYVDARRKISNIFNINTNIMIIMENFNKIKFFFSCVWVSVWNYQRNWKYVSIKRNNKKHIKNVYLFLWAKIA